MGLEESLFLRDSFLNWDLVNDIFLSSVFNADVAETKSYFLVHDHLFRVGTAVHNIDLCDHTDCSDTLGVEVTRHLQTIRRGHIRIRRHHTKNNCAWVRHIPMRHRSRNLLNILRLVSNRDTSDTG